VGLLRSLPLAEEQSWKNPNGMPNFIVESTHAVKEQQS
jgi:hypothetical protein